MTNIVQICEEQTFNILEWFGGHWSKGNRDASKLVNVCIEIRLFVPVLTIWSLNLNKNIFGIVYFSVAKINSKQLQSSKVSKVTFWTPTECNVLFYSISSQNKYWISKQTSNGRQQKLKLDIQYLGLKFILSQNRITFILKQNAENSQNIFPYIQ